MRRKGKFEKLISYTTDASVGLQGGEWYKYITLDAFRKMYENGELFESTMYAGHNYGSRKGDIEDILAQGKHVLTVMDICGAMSLKTHFPNVTTVYVKRDKRELLKEILQKDLSTDETISRLLALDYEMRNADICDYTVSMDAGSTEAAREIVKALF
jgi:guanylate kinase